MKVVWSPQALDDVSVAVDYLVEHHAADAAVKLVERITDLVGKLASEPIDGPEHVLTTGERVRGWPCPPFRIFYQRIADALVVLRVYHQRRQPIVG